MVRFADRTDLERINELRKQVNDVHVTGRPDMFGKGFCKELQDKALAFLNDENMAVIVAERDGVICGFACVMFVTRPQTPTAGERKYYDVDEFGVDEQFRRQGVATELFEFIRADARKRGFDRIELNMWEFNQGALAFYEAMGFKTYRRYMEFEL